ncbi:hypothetical protein F4678DRAFT_428782 [Xylaria arbuscula]|nr:hypothetical protein F4678DRAFT_428782 [Xylaria arbuscula]
MAPCRLTLYDTHNSPGFLVLFLVLLCPGQFLGYCLGHCKAGEVGQRHPSTMSQTTLRTKPRLNLLPQRNPQ